MTALFVFSTKQWAHRVWNHLLCAETAVNYPDCVPGRRNCDPAGQTRINKCETEGLHSRASLCLLHSKISTARASSNGVKRLQDCGVGAMGRRAVGNPVLKPKLWSAATARPNTLIMVHMFLHYDAHTVAIALSAKSIPCNRGNLIKRTLPGAEMICNSSSWPRRPRTSALSEGLRNQS